MPNHLGNSRPIQSSRRTIVKAGIGVGAGGFLSSAATHALAQDASPSSSPVAAAPIPPLKAREGDEVSFSYLRPTWGPATFTKNGPYQQKLEELGKAKIEVQIIPVIDFDTKINTILASGDIPDVCWGGGPSVQIWKDAQDQGAFAPINDYLDAYPAVKDAVPQAFWDYLKDDEGKIYFIPQLIYPVVPFSMYYRKDLFDAKGIKEPTTVDELVAACDALKGDPNVAPLTMGYTWHAKDFATAFGYALNGWQPDESDSSKIVPWFTQQKQIDTYYFFQDLYKRQLLDQNYGVNPEPNLSDDRFEGGKDAICFAHWANYAKFQTSLQKLDPNADVGVISPLDGGGTRMVFPIDRGFYISAAMKNIEGFFDFLNWTLSDGTLFRRFGIEGKTFTMQNGLPTPIPEDEREDAYMGPQIEPVSFMGPMSEKLDWPNTQIAFEAAGIADRFEYVKGKFEEYSKNQFYDYRNSFVISPTEGKDGSRLFEDHLRTVVDSVIINADRTKDDWAAAVQSWRDAGGDTIISEVNDLQTDKSKPNYGV